VLFPRSREGKSRRARDATHTSGLLVFNSSFLRIKQPQNQKQKQKDFDDHLSPYAMFYRMRSIKNDYPSHTNRALRRFHNLSMLKSSNMLAQAAKETL
jgi:hypothetical protein